jgi:hypothetical protein
LAVVVELLMPAFKYIMITGLAVLILFVENILGFLLFFSPGWANGWPFGWRFQTILSVGMSGYVLLELTTVAVGLGAVVGLICGFLRVEEAYVRMVYRGRFWPAVLFMIIGTCIFWRVYVWVWDAFPDGYIIS